MKKIDLHIHTKPTLSDISFCFDIDKMNEYVTKMEIDCVAVTNHNIFDLEQYKLIKEKLTIYTYPGIEVDLDGGHILVIADGEELIDFATKCEEINKRISSQSSYLAISDFKNIFVDLSRYIIIPHYSKKPVLKSETISELASHITAGEVTSPKKFCYCIKDTDSLVPVFLAILDLQQRCQASQLSKHMYCLTMYALTLLNIVSGIKAKYFCQRIMGIVCLMHLIMV